MPTFIGSKICAFPYDSDKNVIDFRCQIHISLLCDSLIFIYYTFALSNTKADVIRIKFAQSCVRCSHRLSFAHRVQPKRATDMLLDYRIFAIIIGSRLNRIDNLCCSFFSLSSASSLVHSLAAFRVDVERLLLLETVCFILLPRINSN